MHSAWDVVTRGVAANALAIVALTRVIAPIGAFHGLVSFGVRLPDNTTISVPNFASVQF